MNQDQIIHPVSKTLPTLEPDVFDTLYELFEHIGRYWHNAEDSRNYQSELYIFIQNRINLYPIYQEYYRISSLTLRQLIEENGKEEAYQIVFTDPFANTPPVDSNLSIVRQKVSNEFVSLQLSLGGFKAFGAKNYPGFIGGAYIPGKPAPYRTKGGE